MNKDVVIRLKTLKQHEYSSFVNVGILLFLTFFFMLLLRKGQGQSVVLFAFAVALAISISASIVFLVLSAHQDKKLHESQTWEIDENSILYSKTSVTNKTKKILFSEVHEIKFDCIDSRLRRGIKVVGADRGFIFIPQNTDRFYEAQVKLKSLLIG